VKTVSVPAPMQGLFDAAEQVVARYFGALNRDPAHGTIEIQGERYVLVRAAALSVEFFDLVRTLYGPERAGEADEFARAILYDLAHAIGKADARRFHERMDLKDPIARLSAGPVHFAHAGWANVAISPESRPALDESFCLYYDHPYSFESDAWVRAGRASDFPVCIMNAGYSSGWCEESFGLDLVGAEILCRGKGDEACRFVMAPPVQIESQIASYLAAHPELGERAASFRIPDFFVRKREAEAAQRRQGELEQELRLTQKLDALGRLASGVAHDFNNLIGVILGHAQLAQRRLGAESPAARDLAQVVQAAMNAASLTQKLLLFGRAQPPRQELVDLNEVVGETAALVGRVIGDDVELSLRLAPDAGSVRVDPAQFEQVLMNLAVNARDAMPQGGRLSLATSRLGEGSVELSVTDSGIGMDEETRARAFEPFFTTKGERGAGLGLSTVYGIVTAAGGSIGLESRPGVGSTFRLKLPRFPSAADARIATDQAIAFRSGAAILVAEDRPELRELLRDSLLEFGYQPILAETVEHAVRLLGDSACKIDLLLTDIVMPRMSGVELAAKAQELRPGLKVLYISGFAPDPKHRELFANNGANFLQKPFAPEQLADKVAAVLGA
jgi:two-component system, cell cycle sensor histidine kinase and response regulator CckA